MSDDCCDQTFDKQRLAAKQAALLAYDSAITALAGGAQSYSLDTGQTRQVVTKANVSEMRIMITQLETEIATLRLRIYGCGVVQVRPAW